jgi:predicted nucleic acid-binding protein
MVFSNTTPFISLCSVNLLHLMPAIFGTVVVAEAVVDECNAGGKFFVPDLTALPWVSVQALQSDKRLPALFELDRGERDTLLLASQHTAALVLMDEKLGRNLAEYMGIQVMGTLGILAKARAQGLIPHFSRAALAMREQGIYFSEGLVHRIAARLGESN